MIDIRIISARVENFRGIRRAVEFRAGDVDLQFATLVVAGPNGCGKTSFIEGILLCLGCESAILDELGVQASDAPHWRAEMPAGAELRVALQVRSAPGTELGTLTPCDLVVGRRPDEWTMSIASVDADYETTIQEETRIRAILGVIDVQYFSSHRAPLLLGGVRPSSGEKSTHGAHRLRRFKQRVIDERTRGSFGSGSRDAGWLEQLNAVWASLRGDGTWLDAGISDPGDPDSDFDLFLISKDKDVFEGRLCAIDRLSSGELEWLALAGTLIPLEFDGLLFIDEPELHQHPEWQARILSVLEAIAPDAQFVIATHADAPWSQSYSFQRLLLVPEGDPRAAMGEAAQ